MDASRRLRGNATGATTSCRTNGSTRALQSSRLPIGWDAHVADIHVGGVCRSLQADALERWTPVVSAGAVLHAGCGTEVQGAAGWCGGCEGAALASPRERAPLSAGGVRL